MFIRTKEVKGHPYAYLVKNKWTKKGPRQKVSKYLGKVHALKPFFHTEFEDFCPDYENLPPLQLIRASVAHELYRHGFKEHKKNIWFLEDFTVNLKTAKVRLSKKPAVLGLNNDFLCDLTLKNLLRFKSSKDKNGVAMDLARAFIQAGIPIGQEVYVKLFQDIYKPGQTFIPSPNIKVNPEKISGNHMEKQQDLLGAKKLSIIVTGTPGTGKTTTAKLLAKELGAEYIDVNEIIKKQSALIKFFDKERDCDVIDENKLSFVLEDLIKTSKGSVVIDSHMSHHISNKLVDCCIVTRCDLPLLKKRLQERSYSEAKVKENLDSEIFEICLQEAIEEGHKIFELNTGKEIDISSLKEKIIQLSS